MPCQKKTRSATNFFCPKMHYAPGWGGNGDKNSTPTELFWAGTKLGHPQKPQVFQFCSGPVYFCLRIVTAQNKYFYGRLSILVCAFLVTSISGDVSVSTSRLFPPVLPISRTHTPHSCGEHQDCLLQDTHLSFFGLTSLTTPQKPIPILDTHFSKSGY